MIIQSNFIYRLIQIFFVFGILFSFISAIDIYLSNLPRESVDMVRSKVHCASGKSYSFNDVGIYSYQTGGVTNVFWLDGDKSKTSQICSNSNDSVDVLNEIISAEEWQRRRSFKTETKTVLVGSQRGAFLKALVAFVFMLLTSFVIKEIILYLFFNKPFLHRAKVIGGNNLT